MRQTLVLGELLAGQALIDKRHTANVQRQARGLGQAGHVEVRQRELGVVRHPVSVCVVVSRMVVLFAALHFVHSSCGCRAVHEARRRPTHVMRTLSRDVSEVHVAHHSAARRQGKVVPHVARKDRRAYLFQMHLLLLLVALGACRAATHPADSTL